jgi:hypothetical protein
MAITCNPVPTTRAGSPSRTSWAISSIAIVAASGKASPGPLLVLSALLWYLLVTAVPFRVAPWQTPNTYPKGGVRRATATSIPTRLGTTSARLSPQSWRSP